MTADPRVTDIRDQIDQIDVGILDLIDRRLRLASELGKLKKEIGHEVFDPERERALLAKLVERSQRTQMPEEKLIEIWGKIIELSRQVQG